MTFAAFGPAILAAMAGGTALAVLLFYLLRRTPRPQFVSNVTFWMRAIQSSRPRFLRASRIPWIAFLISLLVALLLVGELGDPRFGQGVRGTTVIVLEAGRSMGTEYGGQTRAERAIREVRRWVDRTTVGGQVAVVRAGMRPETLLALTEDPADLERALTDFELDDGPADLPGALRLADRIITTSGDPGQILVVADRDAEVDTVATRVLIPVGVPSDTLAIGDFTARRDPLAAGEFVAEVQVVSFASRESSARMRIMDGEVPLLDRRITIPPGDAVTLSAQGFSAQQAELTARLEDIEIVSSTDALAVDDVAHAVVRPLSPLNVLFVSAGNRWLEAALAVHPNANVEQVGPDALGSRSADQLANYDVLVLDRVGLPASIDHRSVVLFSPPDGEIAVDGPVDNPRLSAALASHPALRGVRLDGISVAGSYGFTPQPGDQVLMRSNSDALAIARQSQTHRRIAYGLDLFRTDLVAREAFPLMIHHSLHWAAAASNELPVPHRLGAPILAGTDQTVLDPASEPVSPTERAAIRHQGIYHVGDRAVAFSGAEHAEELTAGVSAGRFRNSDPLPPLAVLVAVGLLLLILLEWGLLHRGRLE